MKPFIAQRPLFAILAVPALAALPGCERALNVVDQLQPAVASGQQAPTPLPSVQNASCACASSPSLSALLCGGGVVPLLENDVVHTTFDGSVVAFSRCNEDLTGCESLHWAGGKLQSLGQGNPSGLSASGSRLLTDGNPPRVVDIDGSLVTVPAAPAMGRGALTADGRSAFAPIWDSDADGFQLARFDVAGGEVETLGTFGLLHGRVAVTPDGRALTGWNSDRNALASVPYEAYRWSRDGGLRFDFVGVPEGQRIWPEAISEDGAVIAGRVLPQQAHFVWSETRGYTEVATASWRSETFGSADGSVVLGSLTPEGGESAAFRWTRETGAVNLMPGRDSVAVDMSAAGDVIVAHSWEAAQLDGAPPEHTFIWNADQGTRTLREVLQARDVDTTGWEFGTPRELSADGRVLLGLGTCGGVSTLYRVVLED